MGLQRTYEQAKKAVLLDDVGRTDVLVNVLKSSQLLFHGYGSRFQGPDTSVARCFCGCSCGHR